MSLFIDKEKMYPCLKTKLVDIELIEANDYNPNNVAPQQLKLLKHSIQEDGFTMPIVCFLDKGKNKYIIVDGFHRYKVGKILKLSQLPISVIDKEIKDRMASTIRHNRARGEHQVDLQSNIVAELFILGWTDQEIGIHLGMQADEVLRLKQKTGIAEIFKNHEYSNSWE